MRRKRIVPSVLAGALVLALLAGCESGSTTQDERVVMLEDGTRTIGFYVDEASLQSIPAPGGGFFGSVNECNDSCRMVSYTGVTRADYDGYIRLLQQEGYTLAADSGEEGIHEDVYYTALQRDETTIHLVYQALLSRLCLIVGEEESLSPNLTYQASYKDGMIEGLRTSLTLCDEAELSSLGIILQLKNGHFLVWDGGNEKDAENLLANLKKLTPEGEKPVIDAWFLTHGHKDHYGAIAQFTNRQDLCDQIVVNGLYVNEPNPEWMRISDATTAGFTAIKMLAYMVKNEQGENPPLYRPVMGQRYYFCDVTLDVISSTEFVPLINSSADLNGTSTMFLVHIDGQKVMITGDADAGCEHNVMKSFRGDYFDLAVYQVPHHGLNVDRDFMEYVAYIQTALDPHRVLLRSLHDSKATDYLMEHCQEFYYQGKDRGTLRLTFPYEVGRIEILGNDFLTYPAWVGNKYTQDLYIEG